MRSLLALDLQFISRLFDQARTLHRLMVAFEGVVHAKTATFSKTRAKR